MAEQHAHSYLQSHQMSGDLLHFTLGQEADALLSQAQSSPQGRAAKTLVKEGPLRLTVIALCGGFKLEQHVAPGPCTIHAFRGAVRLTMGGQTKDLGVGDLVALGEDTAHTVEAQEDSALLLTVTMPPGERASGQSAT